MRNDGYVFPKWLRIILYVSAGMNLTLAIGCLICKTVIPDNVFFYQFDRKASAVFATLFFVELIIAASQFIIAKYDTLPSFFAYLTISTGVVIFNMIYLKNPASILGMGLPILVLIIGIKNWNYLSGSASYDPPVQPVPPKRMDVKFENVVVSGVTKDNAVISAHIKKIGVISPLAYGLQLGTKSDSFSITYDKNVDGLPSLSGSYAIHQNIKESGNSLLPGTRYYFRFYARNESVFIYDRVRCFDTLPVSEKQVDSLKESIQNGEPTPNEESVPDKEPTPKGNSNISEEIEVKLKQIKELHQKGLISDDNYEEMKKEILSAFLNR